MIHVFLPSQLEDYTDRQREVALDLHEVEGKGFILADVIAELEKRFHGIAFRIIDEQGHIRRHIALFVGETLVHSLDVPLSDGARVQIVGALSGG